MSHIKEVAAELFGTALLLMIVVGSGIMGEQLAAGNAAVALLGNSIATGAGLYVLISVLGESFALAAIGGLAGGLLAYGVFNGYQTATMNFQTFSQVAFAFRVTPSLLIQALVMALMMGFLGGLFPAIRAARLPIPSALREL